MDRILSFALLSALSVGAAAQDKSVDSAGAQSREAVLFDALPVVEAASLHAQSLMDAPASVSVITAEDIRRRGYRTLAEALAEVRGLFVSYDRSYNYVGVRGFAIPGDYNTRFLVMVNGHSLTENTYGSAGYFNQDFGLDMDLIERIEIVRGPSSALYGSNGMFATINVVTKSPVEYEAFQMSMETGSFGQKKVQVSSSQYLGRGANLLISASAFHNTGQTLYFPELDSPSTNNGWAVDADGERGYHAFANLIWRNWSFLAYFNDREKVVPTAPWGSVFNDRGTKLEDGRGFVESAYQRDVGTNGRLRWRVYYDQYRSPNSFRFESDQGVADGRQDATGDWVGTQLTYRVKAPWSGFLTVGMEAGWDLRSLTYAYEAAPARRDVARVNRLKRSAAPFFQQEWEFARRWKLYVGGRLDVSRYHGHSLAPRLGLIFQPSTTSAVKLLYGHSFRNPSSYEQFYEDGMSQLANPGLRPERMKTLEGSYEKSFGTFLSLSANAYRYQLSDLIVAVTEENQLMNYQNVASLRSTGVELEAKGQLGRFWKAQASLAVQTSDYGINGYLQVNSPARVGKALVEAPLWRDRLSSNAALQYLSERKTFTGDSVPSVYLVNWTVASRRWGPAGVETEFGVRNLFNRRYWDPAGTGEPMDRLQQDGRCLFVRLSWTPRWEDK